MLLPTFYLSHGGGPLPLMGRDPITADFLKSFPALLTTEERKSIKSILIISAHWEEHKVSVSSAAHPKMLFDYYGFPNEAYEYKYDAPGSPELARRIQKLCQAAEIPCDLDDKRGFDHATFVPLLLAFPEASIPVVQLSLQKELDPLFHINLGEALSSLREDTLLIGSGFSFHNLPALMSGADVTRSKVFDSWIQSTILKNTWEQAKKLLTTWKKAPGASFAHPREEHLMPLHVVFGSSKNCNAALILDEVVMGAKVSAFIFR